jgi:hypothetical protein
MADTFIKDPSAVLDYRFDWKAQTNGSGQRDWLAAAETISTKTITPSTGITVDSSSLTDTNTSVTVWLSGGSAGTDYTVACKIVTSAARTDQRTITIRCRDL